MGEPLLIPKPLAVIEMNYEEKIAKKYFEALNFKTKYEPIGNNPPDFLLNNSIAVEVRRLNKFHNGVPLEKLEFNVVRQITNLINEYRDESPFNKTTLVSICYQRPLVFSKDLQQRIKAVLAENIGIVECEKDFIVDNNLTLNFFEHSHKWGNRFEVVGWTDLNRGGFVGGDLCNSLKIVIDEKEEKVKKYFHQYDEWWLALIDNISYGDPKTLLPTLTKCIRKGEVFKKIIFISPIDFQHNYEINYS